MLQFFMVALGFVFVVFLVSAVVFVAADVSVLASHC